MSQKKIERRSKVKAFVKYVNYTHLLPTRYIVAQDLDLKGTIDAEKMNNKETRKTMKKEIKKIFTDKYHYFSIFNIILF